MGLSRLRVGAALLILISSISLFGQKKSSRPATVSLSLSADAAVADEIKSYTSRELREINDVVVSDRKPDFELNLVAVNVPESDGTNLIAISAVAYLVPLNPPKSLEAARFTIAHAIITDTNLKGICARIAAWFDQQAMEKWRNP